MRPTRCATTTIMTTPVDLPAIGAFNTGKHWQLWMGLFIVFIVIVAPRGLLGLAEKFLNRKGASK